MKQDFYRVLGLTPAATAAEIKTAYKKLALQFHPDRNPGNALAEERFKQINEAYQVLSDKSRRAAYDWLLQYQERQRQSQSQAYSSPPPPPEQEPVSYVARPKPFPWKRILQVSIALLLTAALGWVGYRWWIEQVITKAYQSAQLAEKQQNWAVAEEQYTVVIQHEKEAKEAVARRAHIRYQYLKKYQGAALDFTALLRWSQSPSYTLYLQRAKCWLALKKFSAAVLDLNKIIELNPSNHEAYLDRAVAHLQLEDNWPQAVADLTYYIQVSTGRKQEDALLYRSFAYYRLGEHTLSWEDSARVLASNPQSAQAYYLQAKVKQALHDSVISCDLLAKAAQLGFTIARTEQERLCL